MTRAELARLSGVELRSRLTQRGVSQGDAFRLVERREIPAVAGQILTILNAGKRF